MESYGLTDQEDGNAMGARLVNKETADEEIDEEIPNLNSFDKSRQSTQVDTRKVSQSYIPLTLFAAVLMALSSVLRGLESGTPFSSKYVQSLCYLILSSVTFTYMKCRSPQTFHMPWYTKTAVSAELVFDWKLFTSIVVGGVMEFATSLSVILCFSWALQGNLNQGIGTSLMTFNSAIVSVLSYLVFREVIRPAQMVGILFIIVAVFLLALTSPDSEDTVVEVGSSSTKAGVMLVLYGLLGAIFLSVEIMLNKYMGSRNVPGNISGIAFLLVEGLIGTVCLIIYTLMGLGLHEMTTFSFWIMVLASIACYLALILLNYSLAVGLAGVAISIFNTNPAIQTAFSFFALGQNISIG
jgi:drug/metabolite transporter (DMT)-like permease